MERWKAGSEKLEVTTAGHLLFCCSFGDGRRVEGHHCCFEDEERGRGISKFNFGRHCAKSDEAVEIKCSTVHETEEAEYEAFIDFCRCCWQFYIHFLPKFLTCSRRNNVKQRLIDELAFFGNFLQKNRLEFRWPIHTYTKNIFEEFPESSPGTQSRSLWKLDSWWKLFTEPRFIRPHKKVLLSVLLLLLSQSNYLISVYRCTFLTFLTCIAANFSYWKGKVRRRFL